jgi:hypothetical protein
MIEAPAKPANADVPTDAAQARAIRERARTLLECLERAKHDCEANLQRLKQADAMKAVTGTSALDNAIEKTRQTIEIINKRFGEAQ